MATTRAPTSARPPRPSAAPLPRRPPAPERRTTTRKRRPAPRRAAPPVARSARPPARRRPPSARRPRTPTRASSCRARRADLRRRRPDARDRVAQATEYLRKTYGDADSVTRQLKKFERRGTTGRNRFERQLKKNRTRVERELRTAPPPGRARGQARVSRDVQKQVKQLQSQVDLVSAQVENAVQTGVDRRPRSAGRASRRLAPLLPARRREASRRARSAGLISRRQKQYLSSLNRRGGLRGAPTVFKQGGSTLLLSLDAMPTRDQILEALKVVIDPELRRDIVELDMVRSIDVQDATGVVDVTVSLTTPGCPIRGHFQTAVAQRRRRRSRASPASTSASTCSPTSRRARCSTSSAAGGLPEGALAQVPNVICVGSGKGGVGKSSLTANLAAALAAEGKTRRRARRRRVGLLDPAHARPRRRSARRSRASARSSRSRPHGMKVMSIGFFLEEDEAVVWRGPMLHKALTQFLEDVDWGELDYLLIDLPPGTGDVSMTLAQLLPQAKFLIVTTPQAAAQKVARRSAEMADKVKLEIAGVIENMSGFTTPGRRALPDLRRGRRPGAGRRARRAAARQGAADDAAARAGRRGRAAGHADPDDPAAQAIRQAARGLIAHVADRAAGDAGAGPGRGAQARRRLDCRWRGHVAPARRRGAAVLGTANPRGRREGRREWSTRSTRR